MSVKGPTDGFRPETRAAVDAVAWALELAGAAVGAADVAGKGGRDLATATDLAVEDAVRRILRDGTGTFVIGEERGGEAAADGAPYWLVDPICGTRNFASGTPLYAVNLAFVEAGETTIGVVGDPSTHAIHVAERGGGAFTLVDGARHPIAASADSHTIVVEDGKCTGTRRAHAAQFVGDAIRADRWDFRSLGTTLALAYVAAGRISAYVVFSVSAVHTAAGSLLVTEAGGALSDIDGQPWSITSDSIVASADADLHRELLARIRTASSALVPT